MASDSVKLAPRIGEPDNLSTDTADLDSLASRMADVFDSLSEAIVVVDPTGNVILRNRASREITGVTRPEGGNLLTTINLTVWNLDGSPVDPLDYPASRLLRGLPVRDCEYLAQRADGSRLRILVNGTTVEQDGRISLAVVTYRDITEVRRLEELEDDYVRALSHDLRNLLAVLMGESQMLVQELWDKGLPRASRYGAGIVRTAKRMKLMIDDLADSLRLESGQYAIHRAPVDLRTLVREVVASAEALGTSPMDTEIPEDCPPISIDGSRVERCLLNFLSNAVRYSPPGSPIRVIVTCDEAHVLISVADQGPGIDPLDLPHIFERFYRGRAVVGSDGLGLGLYVCKMAAEAHGGSISVKSVPGNGSVFTLVLPIH